MSKETKDPPINPQLSRNELFSMAGMAAVLSTVAATPPKDNDVKTPNEKNAIYAGYTYFAGIIGGALGLIMDLRDRGANGRFKLFYTAYLSLPFFGAGTILGLSRNELPPIKHNNILLYREALDLGLENVRSIDNTLPEDALIVNVNLNKSTDNPFATLTETMVAANTFLGQQLGQDAKRFISETADSALTMMTSGGYTQNNNEVRQTIAIMPDSSLIGQIKDKNLLRRMYNQKTIRMQRMSNAVTKMAEAVANSKTSHKAVLNTLRQYTTGNEKVENIPPNMKKTIGQLLADPNTITPLANIALLTTGRPESIEIMAAFTPIEMANLWLGFDKQTKTFLIDNGLFTIFDTAHRLKRIPLSTLFEMFRYPGMPTGDKAQILNKFIELNSINLTAPTAVRLICSLPEDERTEIMKKLGVEKLANITDAIHVPLPVNPSSVSLLDTSDRRDPVREHDVAELNLFARIWDINLVTFISQNPNKYAGIVTHELSPLNTFADLMGIDNLDLRRKIKLFWEFVLAYRPYAPNQKEYENNILKIYPVIQPAFTPNKPRTKIENLPVTT